MADDNSIFDKMIEMGMGMTMAREMSRMTENALHSNNQYPQQAPPPIQPASQIYAAINNTQAGPFVEHELITLIQKGMITNTTLVWKPGLPNWVQANQVPEIGKLLLLYSK